MSKPCDFQLFLKGFLVSPESVPDEDSLSTGDTYLVSNDFVCPITGVSFKQGDMAFWDSTYSEGIWRVIRANMA